MSLRINTNIAALNAHRQLTQTDAKIGVSLSQGFGVHDVAGVLVLGTE